MKNFNRTLIISISTLLLMGQLPAEETYFYSREKKIPLKTSADLLFVKFKPGLTENLIKNVLNRYITVKLIEPSYEGYYKIRFEPQSNIPGYLSDLRSDNDILVANPVYLFKESEKILTDKFSVQFVEELSYSQIEEFNNKHHVEIVRKRSGNRNLFSLRVTRDAKLSTLDMANLYNLDNKTVYAVPGFYSKIELSNMPDDIYFSYQYFLHNTGQTGGVTDADIDAPEAWDITTGSSAITVAVIDEGVAAHEDLPQSRITSGWDFAGYNLEAPHNPQDSDPSPDGNEAHGMACAGIIAASWNNNSGIAGIAPTCKIMPIKIMDYIGTFVEDARIADAIDFAWQNGADVLSNSWGFTDKFDTDVDIEAAINRALTQGRDPDGSGPLPAKGCVVVFSTGNRGFVAFPANIPGVLSVGASDKNNNIWSYSGKGEALDIVAPSGNKGWRWGNILELQGDIWTIDIPNLRGYNDGFYGEELGYQMYGNAGGDEDGHYMACYGGTSAAAPQAAGVAALLLSVEPDLHQQDVVYRIMSTADDMGLPANEQGEGRLNAYKTLAYGPFLGIPPDIPVGLSVKPAGRAPTHPKLRWTANTEIDLDGYKIERREGLTGNWLTPTGGILPSTATSFVDWDVFILYRNNPDRVYYRIRAFDEEGLYSDYSDIVDIFYNSFPKVGAPDDSSFSNPDNVLPHDFELAQNFPNPFNPSTTIPFSLPESRNVSLIIYSISGKKIITLIDSYLEKGYHSAKWSGQNNFGQTVSSGIYIYELRADMVKITKKMLFMH